MFNKLILLTIVSSSSLILAACSGGGFDAGMGGDASFSTAKKKSDNYEDNADNDKNGNGIGDDSGNGGNGGKDGGADEGNGGLGGDADAGGNGLNIGEEEVDTPCHFFKKDNDAKHTQAIEGIPVDINIGKYAFTGQGKWDGDDYLIKGKYYELDGKYYASLNDAVQRNKTFNSHSFNAIIVDARSAKCEVVAENEGGAKDHFRKGCFAKGTNITMADMSLRKIENIVKGDQVWNPILKKSAVVVGVIRGPEADKPMYTVGYGDNKTTVTGNHPFTTKSGLKTANSLTKLDHILVAKGEYKKITILKKNPIDPNAYVHNIKIMGDYGDALSHTIEANGVASGDLYLQETLEMQKAKATEVKFLSKAK